MGFWKRRKPVREEHWLNWKKEFGVEKGFDG
jgi:hypothetical protein